MGDFSLVDPLARLGKSVIQRILDKLHGCKRVAAQVRSGETMLTASLDKLVSLRTDDRYDIPFPTMRALWLLFKAASHTRELYREAVKNEEPRGFKRKAAVNFFQCAEDFKDRVTTTSDEAKMAYTLGLFPTPPQPEAGNRTDIRVLHLETLEEKAMRFFGIDLSQEDFSETSPPCSRERPSTPANSEAVNVSPSVVSGDVSLSIHSEADSLSIHSEADSLSIHSEIDSLSIRSEVLLPSIHSEMGSLSIHSEAASVSSYTGISFTTASTSSRRSFATASDSSYISFLTISESSGSGM